MIPPTRPPLLRRITWNCAERIQPPASRRNRDAKTQRRRTLRACVQAPAARANSSRRLARSEELTCPTCSIPARNPNRISRSTSITAAPYSSRRFSRWSFRHSCTSTAAGRSWWILPLLVTIYFGVSRRNPVTGMFLGGAIGILQDALSHDNPIGLFGIAKTIVGYLASTVGARIDTQHPVSRLAPDIYFLPRPSSHLRHHGARAAESSRAVLHAAPAAEFRRHRGVRRRPLRHS